MKLKANVLTGFFLLLILSYRSNAQEFRTFNQNSSRTNHYSSAFSPGLNLTFSPVFSTPLNKSNDSLLFRGNGGGFRIAGDYFFEKVGIGFSSGFGSSSADNDAINRFLQRVNVSPSEVTVTKSNQQNMYLLLGPSVRFGSKVEMLLHAKGGLFINNGGLVMIQQKGAVRPAYMNGSTGKSIYPGFQTGVSVQYSTKSDTWSFGIGADYMGTKTEINNYDQRRNGGTEAIKLSQSISDLVAGINVKYYIPSVKHKYDGNTSKRVLPTVNKREIAIDEPGMLTKRVLPTVNKREIIIEDNGDQTMNSSSCGPVTTRTTNPDGSVSEMTFACPEDAARYNKNLGMPNRISMTTTTPRQTQGATFGEKVQQGLHQQGIIHRDLAARNILMGKISRVTGSVAGIETNESISATTKKHIAGVKYEDISARLYARETGSGMATGRRQYQLVYSDEAGGACNDCAASVASNPLYQSSGNSESNPLYEGKDKLIGGTDDDCDGVSDLNVYLMDAESGAVLASTKTESCGEFFFANLPSGPYVVKVEGKWISKKGYDVYVKNKVDVAGQLLSGNERWTIELNTGTGTAEQAAAVIKTKTKSNQSNDRLINTEQDNSGIIWSPRSNLKVMPMAVADLDGDGVSENVVGDNSAGGYGLVQGAPLKGVGVSLGKIPGGGGANKTAQTNGNGEFEFSNLEAGNYKIMMGQTIVLNDETVLFIGDEPNTKLNKSDAQDYNSTRSNKLSDITKPDNDTTNAPTQKARNNNTVRSNRTDNALINDDNYNNDDGNKMKAQNNNTVRSNRSDNALIVNNDNTQNGKVIVRGWDPEKKESLQKNINTSEDNLKSLSKALNELKSAVVSDNKHPEGSYKSVNTNIQNLGAAITDVQNTLNNLQQKDKDAALQELNQKMMTMNMQFTTLQSGLSKMGIQYAGISNVLKTRHETAKNSISNIR